VKVEAQASRAADAAQFLLDLAGALHEAYMPADQVERRLRQAACGLHLGAEVFTLQTVAAVELWARRACTSAGCPSARTGTSSGTAH